MSRKRVLVTGASGGIGRVLCRHLAMKGYDLIMAARDTAKLSELVQTLSGEFGGCHLVQGVDFSSSDSVQSAVAQQIALSGEINGMVIMPPQAPSTSECLPADAEWDDLFRRCFVNPLAFLRGLLPKIENRTRSKVVIISGISSAQVLSHYATSNVLRCAWLV